MKPKTLLTIRQVRAINAVAHHASLGQASEHLNVSQSSLSRYVAEAERVLGQALFQRGWTGMEPTSQGEIAIAHCRRMVLAIEDAQAAIKSGGARVADLGHHLTWEMLEANDAVRAQGSVSRAAQYLRWSQPDVSRALGKLTAAIGRSPFRRSRAGMAATGDADILSGLYGRLVADAVTMPELLAALTEEVTGRVAVGLLPFSEQDVVTTAFGEVLRRHRHVRLQAVTGSYAALTDGLRKGELDFVLGVLRRQPDLDAFEEIHLYDEAFAIVVREGHRLAQGKPALCDLVNENWVVAPHGTPSRRYFEELLLREGLTPPAQTCEIITFHLAEQMIIHSDAVGLLTYSERRRNTLRQELRILPLDLSGGICPIGLTVRRHQHLTVAQQAFLDILTGVRDRIVAGQCRRI